MGRDPLFAQWYPKTKRRVRQTEPVDATAEAIHLLLRTNNRDTTGELISGLGFNIGLWNGATASFSASVGINNKYVSNAVVLSFQGECPAARGFWSGLMEYAIMRFDPDSAVVTNHDYSSRHGGGPPDEAGGWFVYKRGAAQIECPFP